MCPGQDFRSSSFPASSCDSNSIRQSLKLCTFGDGSVSAVCVGVIAEADDLRHDEVGSVMTIHVAPREASGDTVLHEGVLLVHGIQPSELLPFHEGGEMHEPHLRARAHGHRAGLWATPRASPEICVDSFVSQDSFRARTVEESPRSFRGSRMWSQPISPPPLSPIQFKNTP